MTRVVNITKEAYQIYIGRSSYIKNQHYGNPFSHLSRGGNTIKVASRDEAVNRHKTWLKGESDLDVEQERRIWILNNLHKLKDKVLGCYCHPLRCHGDNYIEMINTLYGNNSRTS